MSLIDYPSLLPSPLISGYSFTTNELSNSTEMHSTFTKKRNEFTKRPLIFKLDFLFTQSELNTFETWFQDDIKDGQEFFNICLDIGILATLEARVIDTYSVSHNGTNFNVSMDIDTIDVSYLDDFAELDPVLDEFETGLQIQRLLDRLDLFVNTESKVPLAQ